MPKPLKTIIRIDTRGGTFRFPKDQVGAPGAWCCSTVERPHRPDVSDIVFDNLARYYGTSPAPHRGSRSW